MILILLLVCFVFIQCIEYDIYFNDENIDTLTQHINASKYYGECPLLSRSEINSLTTNYYKNIRNYYIAMAIKTTTDCSYKFMSNHLALNCYRRLPDVTIFGKNALVVSSTNNNYVDRKVSRMTEQHNKIIGKREMLDILGLSMFEQYSGGTSATNGTSGTNAINVTIYYITSDNRRHSTNDVLCYRYRINCKKTAGAKSFENNFVSQIMGYVDDSYDYMPGQFLNLHYVFGDTLKALNGIYNDLSAEPTIILIGNWDADINISNNKYIKHLNTTMIKLAAAGFTIIMPAGDTTLAASISDRFIAAKVVHMADAGFALVKNRTSNYDKPPDYAKIYEIGSNMRFVHNGADMVASSSLISAAIYTAKMIIGSDHN